MDGNVPYLDFEQLLLLLETCQNGHDCQNENELIDLAISIALFSIRESKKLIDSPELDQLHYKFVDFKNLRASKRHLNSISDAHHHGDDEISSETNLEYHADLVTNKKNFPQRKSKQKKPTRTNIKKLLQHIDKLGWGRGDEKLFMFYKKLIELSWIFCQFPEFKSHFKALIKPTTRIVFLKPAKVLARLFFRLRQEAIVPETYYKVQILLLHFCPPVGEFNEAELRKNPGGRLSDNLEEIIDEIVMLIKK